MTTYYSKSENGFFDSEIFGEAGTAGCRLPADAVAIDDADRRALLADQSAGKLIDFSGSAPDSVNRAAPTNAQLWSSHQAQAKAALDASDITVLRCVEHGVAVPAEWATYRADLRAIVSASTGDATQPLPTRPAYPAGT